MKFQLNFTEQDIDTWIWRYERLQRLINDAEKEVTTGMRKHK